LIAVEIIVSSIDVVQNVLRFNGIKKEFAQLSKINLKMMRDHDAAYDYQVVYTNKQQIP
jgi:hypothetical protein